MHTYVCTYLHAYIADLLQMRTTVFIDVYGSHLCCFVDPPAITAIEATGVCTNDFTVSWTAASSEDEISYGVTVFPPSMMSGMAIGPIMDTSHNFTDLMPNTIYNITVTSTVRSTSCVGITNTIMVTTLTVAEGVPASELIVVNMCL